MKCKSVLGGIVLFFVTLSPLYGSEEEVYEGDQRLACEALLCLTFGWGESECRPAIKRFFSIWTWKPSKLFDMRMNFLGLCPSDMARVDQALIVNYAGRCTGKRFDRYVAGLGSTVEVEGEHSRRLESCSWHDGIGVWWHPSARGKNCSNPRGSDGERFARATRECSSFRSTFGAAG
ncbi:hypothetical protein EOL70_26285 [Leucothrix sargassi]|nr:hypothetical protein EOL70_26285 [Leucothrix sargassi]